MLLQIYICMYIDKKICTLSPCRGKYELPTRTQLVYILTLPSSFSYISRCPTSSTVVLICISFILGSVQTHHQFPEACEGLQLQFFFYRSRHFRKNKKKMLLSWSKRWGTLFLLTDVKPFQKNGLSPPRSATICR